MPRTKDPACDTKVTLNQVSYPLRPSFQALRRIEEETGMGFFSLAQKLLRHELTPAQTRMTLMHLAHAASSTQWVMLADSEQTMEEAEMQRIHRQLVALFSSIVEDLNVHIQ